MYNTVSSSSSSAPPSSLGGAVFEEVRRSELVTLTAALLLPLGAVRENEAVWSRLLAIRLREPAMCQSKLLVPHDEGWGAHCAQRARDIEYVDEKVFLLRSKYCKWSH